MTRIAPYDSSYADAWDEYVTRSPHSTIAHRSGWRDVMAEGLGHTPLYRMALDGQRLTGILPLFLVTTWWRTRYLVSLPWIDYGGICADDESTEQALLAEARQLASAHGVEFVEFRSVEQQPLDLTTRTDKVTFLMPLESDSEIVWKRFDAKLRNQIRKSEKSGLTTEFGGVDKLDSFYRVFAYNMRDLGTPVWGKHFFRAILRQFPNSAQLILVKRDNEVIAGGLVLSFKDRVYVPSASSYRWSLSYCPNHALYWAVIRYGCEHGLKYLDFGRSSWDGPTFNFKKQWGAPPTQLHWQYALHKAPDLPAINPGNPKYRLFIKLWQRLPLRVANWLGPRVIRNFP
ncbi:MAG: FemAB family XrtA/PEP-CTERM system-associated protein [Candidatus Zixiibacteriota bacterium]